MTTPPNPSTSGEPPQGDPTAPPSDPNSPQARAQIETEAIMANPTAVPDQFKNPDGSINQTFLFQTLLAAQKGEAPPAPNTGAPAPEAGSLAPPAGTSSQTPASGDAPSEASTLAEALEGAPPPKPDALWATVEQELSSTGNISEGTLKGLRDAGVPDSLVALAQYGREAKGKNDMAAAHEITGGKEGFDATMNWAKANLSPAEKQQVTAGLNSPQALLVLQGLHARAAVATAPSGQVTTTNQPGPAIAPNAEANIQPFRSSHDQHMAMADKRYITDGEYRAEVDRRVMMGAGFTVEQTRNA